MIHTEFYLATLRWGKAEYPNGHFEIVTRQEHNYLLSPTWNLLKHAKNEGWTFEQYSRALFAEWGLIFSYAFLAAEQVKNKYTEKLHELLFLSQQQDLFLICFEKMRSKCHREIIKALLLGWTPNQILENIRLHNDHLIVE